MSYAEVSDIQSEFKSINFSESDASVGTTEVEDFISQSDAEIDARISVKYSVPVTAGASALLLLKQISTWLVASRIKYILEVKNVRAEIDQDVKTDMASLARKMLDQIAAGDIPLIGATLASSDSGVKSYVSSNNIERVFYKDEDNW